MKLTSRIIKWLNNAVISSYDDRPVLEKPYLRNGFIMACNKSNLHAVRVNDDSEIDEGSVTFGQRGVVTTEPAKGAFPNVEEIKLGSAVAETVLDARKLRRALGGFEGEVAIGLYDTGLPSRGKGWMLVISNEIQLAVVMDVPPEEENVSRLSGLVRLFFGK